MKTPFLKSAGLAALLALSFTSCTKCDDHGDTPEGCAANIVCTADFRSINITVKDSAGHPVAFDDYKTIRQRGNASFPQQDDVATEQDRKARGVYPVASDNLLRQTNKDGEQFDFYGYKGGKLVIKRTYTIGHDCCHIQQKDNNSQTVTVSVPN